MMNPDSAARFGARTQGNILTPHFGQVNPAMARRVGANAAKQFAIAGKPVNPSLKRPAMSFAQTQPRAQKANNGIMLLGLLLAATMAGVAWRNTRTIAPMVKKALEENNKGVMEATKTSVWGYTKDALLGTLGLTGTGFGLYGSFRKTEDKAATTVANQAKTLATNANTKVGTFEARLGTAETNIGNLDTGLTNAELGIGELTHHTDKVVTDMAISEVLRRAYDNYRGVRTAGTNPDFTNPSVIA